MNYHLYGYFRSSASYRVRLALLHKDLPFTQTGVSLLKGEQREAVHVARNPLAQVPVLELQTATGPVHLAQSLAIIEYLDEVHPSPALLPREPLARARVRELSEIVNAGTQPLQNTPVLDRVKNELGGDRDGWARHFIRVGLEALEARAKHTGGAFLVGDVPSLADVCLVPQMYNARRFGVSLDGLETLVAIDARATALPRWSLAHPDRQPDAPPA